MSDVNTLVIEPLKQFVKDSTYLVKKCTKPDHKGKLRINLISIYIFINFLFHIAIYIEFAKVARATGLGFLLMGFIGFFVKLIHIPINNIIMGGM